MTERLEDYTAPLLFEEDTGYMLFAVDNLEFYLKRKFQRRLWNGEKLLNEILHTYCIESQAGNSQCRET